MKRMLFVVGGAFLLILAGYLIGAKKAGDFKAQMESAAVQHEKTVVEFDAQMQDARGVSDMWRIRAELLVAAQDVSENNYGNASRRIQRVIEHLELRTAEGQPEAAALLAMVKKGGDAVLNMDATAAISLRQAAADVGSRLDP